MYDFTSIQENGGGGGGKPFTVHDISKVNKFVYCMCTYKSYFSGILILVELALMQVR